MAKAEVEEPEVDGGDEKEKSATIGDVERVVTDAINSIKELFAGGGKPGDEPAHDEPAGGDVEEIESPRQQESRMRREVESAIGALHIHVGEEQKEKKAKVEPEQTPGKKPFLERFIGMGA